MSTPPRLFTVRRLVQLGGLAGLSMALNLGVTFLAHEAFGLPEHIAYATALVVVLVVNFLVLRHGIFKSQKRSAFQQGVLFLACSILFRGLEYATWLPVFHLFERHGIHYLFANISVSMVFTLAKYAFYGMTVFRPDKP